MEKTVRLSDIGKKLNVSTVTVSKALSGQKGVSDELRAKIVRLADEMGYVRRTSTEANPQKGASCTIGVLIAERYLQENQSFYWMIYQSISKQAISRNCFSILEVITYEAERTCELPKVVTESKIDGIILMGEFSREYLGHLLSDIALPFLSLDTPGRVVACDSVVSNNMMGGYQMTNYLFSLGHSRIGFVGTRLATASIDDRYFGYLKAMMEHGIPWREDWVIDDRNRDDGKVYDPAGFVLPEDMPTAFFCNCDLSASVLIRTLEGHGYAVPEDVSVVGFDNYLPEQLGGVELTTYEIDTAEMAKRAVHIIVHKIRNQNYSTGIFMLPGKFIEGKSARRIGQPVPFV